MRYVRPCILGAALLAATSGCGTATSESAGPQGTPAIISAGLVDLEGRPFDLWSHPVARATVVLFTRGDCPISNRYAPEVARLSERFQARGVAFYLVYVHPDESADAIRQHVAEYGYPCRAIRDPEHRLVQQTGATVTPEAVVFNSERQVTYRGRIDDLYLDFGKARQAATTHELADAIESTLAGRQTAEPVTKAVGCYIADLR